MLILYLVSILVTIYSAMSDAKSIICKPGYKFWHYFGLPGCGKTTIAADVVRNAKDSGRVVYSNVPIRGARVCELKDIGISDLHDCDLIIDEAGSELGNRSWHSNLSDRQIKIIKKYRHYHINIHLFSQAHNDYDNKFRDLVNRIFLVQQSKIPFFVVARAVIKKLELQNGQFVTFYEWDRQNNFRIFAPKDWAYFNSYDTEKDLKPMYEKYYTILDTK